MKANCPKCCTSIAMDDMNVATDIALCRRCESVHPLSTILDTISDTAQVIGVDLSLPPRRRLVPANSGRIPYGATTRSWNALFYIPFTCFWSGMSLSGIYGKQIRAHELSLGASFFGLPFLFGTCILVSMCLMSLAGKVELERRGDQLIFFVGLSDLGWTRTRLWSDFQFVCQSDSAGSLRFRNNRGPQIVLEGRSSLYFGSGLSPERQSFIVKALRSELWNNRFNRAN